MSYLLLTPIAYTIFTFYRYWTSDSTAKRKGLVIGMVMSFGATLTLYIWFFIYFLFIEEMTFTSLEYEIMIMLIFSLP